MRREGWGRRQCSGYWLLEGDSWLSQVADIQDSASAPGTEGVQDREINCVSGLHAGQ